MNKNYYPSITQAHEPSSYLKLNFPVVNLFSKIMTKNRTIRIKKKTHSEKLFIQLNNQTSKMNNKKELILDEDDTKNNLNFIKFMDNLLTKDSFEKNKDNENSTIHSNKNFFTNNKIENNSNINTNSNCNSIKKEEEDIYYTLGNKFLNRFKNNSRAKIKNSLSQNKYNIKNYLSSVPRKSSRKLFYDINNKNIQEKIKSNIKVLNINNNNYNCKNNNNDIDIEKNNTNFSSNNIGINCKLSDLILEKKRNKRNLHNRKNRNDFDYLSKLTQTFSTKHFDGKMLNQLLQLQLTDKKSNKKRNSNGSHNHTRRSIFDCKIPKIIFPSRNDDKKDKENEQKLMTIKVNAIHFLKDNNQNSLTSKSSYRNINEKMNLTLNKKISKNVEDLKETYFYNTKYNIFNGNENNLIPYLKKFQKSDNKKTKRKTINIENKKYIFSSFK